MGVAQPEGMTKTIHVLVGSIALAASGPALAAAAKAPAATPASGGIEIWVRGAGALQGDQAPRARVQRIDLDSLPLVEGKRFDAQYGGQRAMKGIALASLIEKFAPEPSLDLAILHIANGMAVPVPFRDVSVMKRLDPFVARAMETHPGGPVRAGFFPAIRRKGATEDPRPIVFSANKIVVPVLWHPSVPDSAQPAFSPWRHTDTLTDIELVASAPYYKQFNAGGDGFVQQGQFVFQQSCQFCHGVRKVGAKFGWDFVEPAPIYTVHRPAKSLFLHVAYKPLDAAERGLMMPAMSFMSQEDAALLWRWLRAVATSPMPAYAGAPAATGGKP
jgi:mono/diheme cytochrome c family protein